MNIPGIIAQELNLTNKQVEAALSLFEEGATVPFIARYRKERTGGLDEEILREVEDRNNYLNLLQDRKATILASIEEQGKLTDELKARIEACTKLQELEDLYLPYKPKRKTRGTIAKAKGLEPLALFILENPEFEGSLEEKAAGFINEEKEVASAADAIQGAKDIIAEMMSDNADVRKAVREYLMEDSFISSEKVEKAIADDEKNEKLKAKQKKDTYQIYFDFRIDIKSIKPYQVLALNRGEKEKFLKVSIEFEDAVAHQKIKEEFFEYTDSAFMDLLNDVIADSFKRLIFPSIEREVRNALSELSDTHAIEVFAQNLRSLLLQPPLGSKTIMGIDPGFASGSKVAVIDNTGKYLYGATIYPHPPQKKISHAREIILDTVEKYNVHVIAIGNGTASRETEQLVADLIRTHNLDCQYIIVSEAGASVYSASRQAKEEFPDLEASMRGNISIARRLLDPLSELVKIDPKSIGVGLYQHDVDQKMLQKKLDDVVVSCVNYVGVDVNTASVPLLTHVSGLNRPIARRIIQRREEKGPFKTRQELMDVSGIGDKVFEQCAGFLKVYGGENPLDATFIHPESYSAVEQILSMLKINDSKVAEIGPLMDFYINKTGFTKILEQVNVGEPTFKDIIFNLKRPGRDPREELPKPILRSDVLKIEDLRDGMQVKGTVRNVVDFGAFIDIGVKEDGLLHISQMKKGFVKNPLDVMNVGDVVEVTIIGVDIDRGRISLSMRG